MKKFLLIIAALVLAQEAFAQLKPPTITQRDTLFVAACYYCGEFIKPEDCPCKFFEESASNIYIAGQVYNKGKATFSRAYMYEESWRGHVDIYIYGNATVNGKKATVSIIKAREDCKDYPMIKYVIDDYEFIAERIQDVAQRMEIPIDTVRAYVQNESK